jgi:hypothetical protein
MKDTFDFNRRLLIDRKSEIAFTKEIDGLTDETKPE